jgi:GT2 family glycosyltransferase
MTPPRKVSVAILSWNGRHHLETCLQALADQAPPGVPWEVLVLDNGSTDGTADWLRERYPQPAPGAPAAPPATPAPPSSGVPVPPTAQAVPAGQGAPSVPTSKTGPAPEAPAAVAASRCQPSVRWLRSAVNLGFCAGNNRLVAAAEGDAVAFLNNDTRPRRGWLRALVAALAAAPADVAAVSGQIVDWAGERLDFGRGVMTFDGHAFQLDFKRRLVAARLPAEGEELLFACGGNMLVRKASFLAAGGFDESYFAYLEDVDLGWRLWSGGERIVFAPAAVVHHRSNATSDLLGLYNRGFLFERNAFLTAYKNYEPGLWEQLMPALLLTFLSRTQTMLADNNPGGGSLRVDPYAGWIANTAGPAAGAPAATDARHAAPSTSPAAARRAAPGTSPAAAEPSAPAPAATAVGPSRTGISLAGLGRKWRDYGPREFCRRAAAKLLARLRSTLARGRVPGPAASSGWGRAAAAPRAPLLTDERTVAQLRALSYLLSHLEDAAAARQAVQRRRRRSDRDILARFPLYLVPTYPGDEALFASAGFTAWLPQDLPLLRRTLAEVMELDERRDAGPDEAAGPSHPEAARGSFEPESA